MSAPEDVPSTAPRSLPPPHILPEPQLCSNPPAADVCQSIFHFSLESSSLSGTAALGPWLYLTDLNPPHKGLYPITCPPRVPLTSEPLKYVLSR